MASASAPNSRSSRSADDCLYTTIWLYILLRPRQAASIRRTHLSHALRQWMWLLSSSTVLAATTRRGSDLLMHTVPIDEGIRYPGWRVAAGAGVGVFFGSLAFATFPVFLKPLSEEFSWSREAVSTAFGAMTLGAALSTLLVGIVADRVGATRICGSCLLVCGLAFASLSMLTPQLQHLYIVFAVVGLAIPGTSAVVYSRALSSWFDRRRGAALAVVMASAAVGSIVLPPAASALIARLGWRGACLLLGATSLLVGVPIVVRTVREHATTPAHEWARAPGNGVSVFRALASRVFWILIAVVFGSTLALTGVVVHLSALLTDRGLPASQAALVLSVLGGVTLAGRLVTGWCLDRFAEARVACALLALAALGTFSLIGATSFSAAAPRTGHAGRAAGDGRPAHTPAAH